MSTAPPRLETASPPSKVSPRVAAGGRWQQASGSGRRAMLSSPKHFEILGKAQAHVLSSPRAGCSHLAVPETAWDEPVSPSMLGWAGHWHEPPWWDEAAELQLPSCHGVTGGFLHRSCE